MKTTGLIFLFVFFIFITKVSADPIKGTSRVETVTVFADSALVTRSVDVELNPGMNQVELEIIPEIDENALTVSGHGTAEAKIHGAFIKREYIKESSDERRQNLLDQIEKKGDEINLETEKIETLDAQKEFIKSVQMYSNQQLPKELATKMPTVPELEGLVSFVGVQNTALQEKKQPIELHIRELNKEKEVLARQLSQLIQPLAASKHLIVVNVECLKKGALTINVSYYVRGVFWYPVYNARADLDKDNVELSSFGIVKQTTGEDWPDVDLILSTAKPSISGQLPYVAPWVLRPYQAYAEKGKVSSSRAMGAMAPTAQYEPYYLSSEFKEISTQNDATVAMSTVDFKGVSVIYKLPGKVTVKSDGTEHKLPVSSQVLNARFSYSAYPRLSPYAYLGTRVKNAEDLQLLGGKVYVFLEGDYVGQSNITNIGPGEEFDLFLGIDENVKIERKEIQKKVDDVLIAGIPSPNRQIDFKYKITTSVNSRSSLTIEKITKI